MYWFAIAMSPAIALVWFFYARNAYRPERKSLIAFLFVLGGFSALIALGPRDAMEPIAEAMRVELDRADGPALGRVVEPVLVGPALG